MTLVNVCDPTDFRTLATIRSSSLEPAKVYEQYGHVVLYEKGGERRLIGYVNVDEDGKPYLYREDADMSTDRYGRRWNLPETELCSECGQPDNCGDCSHEPLGDLEARQLGADIERYGHAAAWRGTETPRERYARKVGVSVDELDVIFHNVGALDDVELAKELAFARAMGDTGAPTATAWHRALEDEDERRALRREARQEALLDAGSMLAEHNRSKGE